MPINYEFSGTQRAHEWGSRRQGDGEGESGQPIERRMVKQEMKASDVKLLKELQYENSRSGIHQLSWLPADRPS
jgi:hypothetical protein